MAKPEPPSASAHPSAPSRVLFGRSAELAEILDALDRSRIVGIVGFGGVGKTRVALEIVERLAARGWLVGYVDLGGLRDAALVPGEAAAALGAPDEPADVTDRIARRVARSASTLLVLDNLQQLPAASAWIGGVVQAVPGLRFLVTGRTALGLPGAITVRLGPLGLPSSTAVGAVNEAPATSLFIARARQVGWLDVEDPTTAADIAHICRRLDGLPLAIELAAARTRLLTPSAIERRLAAGGDTTFLADAGGGGQHRSLDAVFEWTFELLGGDERRMLTATAICLGPFDLETAATLCPGVATLDVLEQLVATSLVMADHDPAGEPRLRVLEVVRRACLARIGPDERKALRARRLAAMVAAIDADRETLLGPDRVAAVARLAERLDDLRAAFDDALELDRGAAVRLVAPIWRFWASIGRRVEAIGRLRTILEAEPGPTRTRAWALAGLAGLLQIGGTPAQSAPAAEEAARIARRVGDRQAELEALPGVALAAIEAGDDTRARRASRRALSIAREVGDRRSLVRALATLGIAEGRSGHPAAGVRHLQDAIEAARLAGDPLNEAIQLINLAELEVDLGRWRESLVHSTAAVAQLRGLDGGPYLAGGLIAAGYALTELGRLEHARDVFAEAFRVLGEDELGTARAASLSNVLPYLERIGAVELAARAWGALLAMDAGGVVALTSRDRMIGRRLLDRCAERVRAARLQTWVQAGQSERATALLDEVETVIARRDAEAERRGTPSQFILTPREGEVLRLLGEGLSDTELGRRLSISPKTASVHVANIKAKLAVRTRLEAAMAGRALMDAQGPG